MCKIFTSWKYPFAYTSSNFTTHCSFRVFVLETYIRVKRTIFLPFFDPFETIFIVKFESLDLSHW